MSKEIAKEAEIKIKVGMDQNHRPVQITWTADDAAQEEEREVKALMLSLWDAKENNSMRIDLWGPEFMVEDMKAFVYQTIISMADTLERATNDREAAGEMKEFAVQFGEKAGLLK